MTRRLAPHQKETRREYAAGRTQKRAKGLLFGVAPGWARVMNQ